MLEMLVGAGLISLASLTFAGASKMALRMMVQAQDDLRVSRDAENALATWKDLQTDHRAGSAEIEILAPQPGQPQGLVRLRVHVPGIQGPLSWETERRVSP